MSWHPVENGWRREVEDPDALVIVLHGYGKSGGNITTRLAEPLSRQLPNVAFFAPDGFEPWEGQDPPGFQWFSRQDITPALRLQRLEALYPRLQALLAQELARVELPPERLVLAGFSQGAILALHHLAVSRQRHARVIAYAGRLATPPLGANATPVSIVYGTTDGGGESLTDDVMRLRAAGHPVQVHLLEGVGHDITPDGVAIGVSAIRTSLKPTRAAVV